MPAPDALREVLFAAARDARDILLRHLGKVDADHKGDVDLVTLADRESEAAVARCIAQAFPDHAIVGEESIAAGGPSAQEAQWQWVVDPLDGTMNYAHGVPMFAVSIAVIRGDETRMGLVVDPVRDEWFFAERGKGAFLNDRPIGVSTRDRADQALLATGFPHDRRENIDGLMRVLGAMLMRTHGVLRLGAAALDLCYVAAGRIEAFYEEHLSPWDVAAGNLIVEESGGRATDYSGRPARTDDRELLASNGLVHDELLAILREHWRKW